MLRPCVVFESSQSVTRFVFQLFRAFSSSLRFSLLRLATQSLTVVYVHSFNPQPTVARAIPVPIDTRCLSVHVCQVFCDCGTCTFMLSPKYSVVSGLGLFPCDFRGANLTRDKSSSVMYVVMCQRPNNISAFVSELLMGTTRPSSLTGR